MHPSRSAAGSFTDLWLMKNPRVKPPLLMLPRGGPAEEPFGRNHSSPDKAGRSETFFGL